MHPEKPGIFENYVDLMWFIIGLTLFGVVTFGGIALLWGIWHGCTCG